MDTSETYIKMCEKATEIQTTKIIQVPHGKELPLEEGDYIFDGEVVILISDDTRSIHQYDQYRPKFSVSLAGYCEGDGYDVDKLVWLPRQDQLQEMVKGKTAQELIRYFDGFSNPMKCISMKKAHFEEKNGELDLIPDPEVMNQPQLDYPKQFKSMEQLWLAFVMKEKFNKVWDDSDWIQN